MHCTALHAPMLRHLLVSAVLLLSMQAMLREALGKLHQVKANFTPVGISGERSCACNPWF